MSQKTAETRLTKKQLKFAKLKYEDDLNDEKIATLCGISARTVYEWIKKPEIQKEIDQLGEADTKTAFRYFQKNARRAAKVTVRLTDTESTKDEHGNIIKQTFIQPGEVVRKAAADILQAVKIDVKGGESGASGVTVYLPDNRRQTKKSETESDDSDK